MAHSDLKSENCLVVESKISVETNCNQVIIIDKINLEVGRERMEESKKTRKKKKDKKTGRGRYCHFITMPNLGD